MIKRTPTVHDVIREAIQDSWISREDEHMFAQEMCSALLNEAMGLGSVAGVDVIFDEILRSCGHRRNAGSYYRLKFEQALAAHREEIAGPRVAA